MKTPQDRYCKELLDKAVKVDNLLKMRDWQLDDDWHRQKIKSNLLEAKPILMECFSIFRKMVMEGYKEGVGEDEDKFEKIRKGFTGLRTGIKKFEEGQSGGPSQGILNKTTYPMVVKRYRNLLKKILDDLIIQTVKDAGESSDTTDDFYRAIFEKTYQWTGSQIFKVWARENEEGEVVGVGEEGEEGEVDDFTEVVGEIV